MVWAISIICVSLSCERIPVVAGWLESNDECLATAKMIMESWQPTVGFYEVACFTRSMI